MQSKSDFEVLKDGKNNHNIDSHSNSVRLALFWLGQINLLYQVLATAKLSLAQQSTSLFHVTSTGGILLDWVWLCKVPKIFTYAT